MVWFLVRFFISFLTILKNYPLKSEILGSMARTGYEGLPWINGFAHIHSFAHIHYKNLY